LRLAWPSLRQQPTRLPLQRANSWALIDCYRFVARFQRLAIFRNLNRVLIENTNRDVLGAEFHRAIGRGNPAFKRGIFSSFADGDLNVSPFECTNSDVIWRA